MYVSSIYPTYPLSATSTIPYLRSPSPMPSPCLRPLVDRKLYLLYGILDLAILG